MQNKSEKWIAIDWGTSNFRAYLLENDKVIDQISSNNWKHLKKIQLPILYPSLITSFTLVFLESIKELPATLILRPFNFDTLAVKGFELATDERLADAAPAVITIVIIGLIPIAILSKSISQKYGRNNE